MSETLLEIQNIEMTFGGLKAISDFSMTVKKGQIVGLIGPNGAGKTTVFNCISRFYKPTKGRIVFDGQDLTAKRTDDVIKMGVARTFQNVELFKSMTVMENLLLGQHTRMRNTVIEDALSLPSSRSSDKKSTQRALEILQELSIKQYANKPVAMLPFGVQKMVEMARALVSNPKLILLDEPAAGSNPNETNKLSALIKHIRNAYNVTVLLVEHDMSLVMDICEQLYVLDFGKKIAEGAPAEIQSNPAVIEAYLGDNEEVLD
ncbi:ABC transporter ATP-binding protein [Candidatus Chlorohelix sp.]|uniref:ABC transporter ATP-binding protein n=1 Tax=Candidatus Chlorohelix sp. TaxID=3139201 RepID=UPI003065C0A2